MAKTTATELTKSTKPAARATGVLQRNCGCGRQTLAGSACPCCSGVQRKLTIGAANDPLEREADRVAERVLTASASSGFRNGPLRIQRQGRQSALAAAAPATVEQTLADPGRPLQATLRADMERCFNHDFSQVRVHTDGAAGRSAQSIDALAYTRNNHVVFAPRQYDPQSSAGRRLLAHELTHVVQQGASAALPVQRKAAGSYGTVGPNAHGLLEPDEDETTVAVSPANAPPPDPAAGSQRRHQCADRW